MLLVEYDMLSFSHSYGILYTGFTVVTKCQKPYTKLIKSLYMHVFLCSFVQVACQNIAVIAGAHGQTPSCTNTGSIYQLGHCMPPDLIMQLQAISVYNKAINYIVERPQPAAKLFCSSYLSASKPVSLHSAVSILVPPHSIPMQVHHVRQMAIIVMAM